MGYHVYITRKDLWIEEEGSEITPDEWLAVVESDPELTLEPRNGPYVAFWDGPGAYSCWLDYEDGNLFSKSPTNEFLDKMAEIARRLGAKVQGEDGEEEV